MSWGRVLMIDEDALFRRLVTEYLASEGMELVSTSRVDIFAVSEAARSHIILVGRSIVDEQGVDIIEKLRSKSKAPVILISDARKESSEDISADVSAEMIKPFDLSELYERMLSLMEVRRGEEPVALCVEYDGLVADLENAVATVDGIPLQLSVKEVEMLHLLMSYPERIFSREEIASRVWGRLMTDNNIISVHINRIRNNVGRYRQNIVSVRGSGYRFKA